MKAAWYVVDTSNKILTQLFQYSSLITLMHINPIIITNILVHVFQLFACTLFHFRLSFIRSKVSPGHVGFNCSYLIYKLCFSVTRKTFWENVLGSAH